MVVEDDEESTGRFIKAIRDCPCRVAAKQITVAICAEKFPHEALVRMYDHLIEYANKDMLEAVAESGNLATSIITHLQYVQKNPSLDHDLLHVAKHLHMFQILLEHTKDHSALRIRPGHFIKGWTKLQSDELLWVGFRLLVWMVRSPYYRLFKSVTDALWDVGLMLYDATPEDNLARRCGVRVGLSMLASIETIPEPRRNIIMFLVTGPPTQRTDAATRCCAAFQRLIKKDFDMPSEYIKNPNFLSLIGAFMDEFVELLVFMLDANIEIDAAETIAGILIPYMVRYPRLRRNMIRFMQKKAKRKNVVWFKIMERLSV